MAITFATDLVDQGVNFGITWAKCYASFLTIVRKHAVNVGCKSFEL
jgi:hypothetical protein